jgi:hypothetical protein
MQNSQISFHGLTLVLARIGRAAARRAIDIGRVRLTFRERIDGDAYASQAQSDAGSDPYVCVIRSARAALSHGLIVSKRVAAWRCRRDRGDLSRPHRLFAPISISNDRGSARIDHDGIAHVAIDRRSNGLKARTVIDEKIALDRLDCRCPRRAADKQK